MKKQSIYLDYAAATPMDMRVLEAMRPYFSEKFHNPSSTYLAGQAAKRALGDARASVARILGSKPVEVVFTAGATEANNLAIQGVMHQFPESEVLISAIEHDSVLEPAKLLSHKIILVDPSGLVDIENLKKIIGPKTVLISVGMVNNELGTIQPLKEIAALIGEELLKRKKTTNKAPLYLHTDAAQAGNYLDLHASRLGVDLMSINGGKIYGPKQSGVLFIKTGVQIEPLILGGAQERNLRSGTENLAAAIGLATALDIAQQNRLKEARRVIKLRESFIKNITAKIPKAVINGSTKHTAPHIVSLSLPGFDNERLMMELDELGIQCATGSACSASSQEPSHVLSAIGLSDELARSTLRFSLGRHTSEEDTLTTVRLLHKITKQS